NPELVDAIAGNPSDSNSRAEPMSHALGMTKVPLSWSLRNRSRARPALSVISSPRRVRAMMRHAAPSFIPIWARRRDFRPGAGDQGPVRRSRPPTQAYARARLEDASIPDGVVRPRAGAGRRRMRRDGQPEGSGDRKSVVEGRR